MTDRIFYKFKSFVCLFVCLPSSSSLPFCRLHTARSYASGGVRLFPLLPVKGFDSNLLHGPSVQAMNGHGYTIRVGSRVVKTLNATGGAEHVASHASVESVLGEGGARGQEGEIG